MERIFSTRGGLRKYAHLDVGHEIMMKSKLKAIALNKHAEQDNRGLRRLDPKMILLFGDPHSYITLGKFLTECGKQMKKPGPFHRHFRDYLRTWSPEMVDVVAERCLTGKQKKRQGQP